MNESMEIPELERRELCHELGVEPLAVRPCPAIGRAFVYEFFRGERSCRAYIVRTRDDEPRATSDFAAQLERCAALAAHQATPVERVVSCGRLVALVTDAPIGTRLATWLERERRLPFLEAHLVLRDISRALAAAHEAGLFDGGLCESRVYWGAPWAKVGVLGIGALTSPAPLATDDVLAFGRLAFRVLTGESPVDAVDRSVARRRSHVPPGLARLVARCLELDPARRPEAAELERFLRLLAVPAPSARQRHLEAQRAFAGRQPAPRGR